MHMLTEKWGPKKVTYIETFLKFSFIFIFKQLIFLLKLFIFMH